MRMTPIAPAALAPTEVRITRLADGTDSIARGSAAGDYTPGVWARYGRYLLDLPGALMVSASTKWPNEIRAEFENLEFAALARNAVVDALEGITITMTSRNDRPLPSPGGPYPWNWWDNPANVFRAISGVRGIVNIDRGVQGATVWADSQGYLDKLRPLFRRQLASGEYLGWYVWPHPPGGSRPPRP